MGTGSQRWFFTALVRRADGTTESHHNLSRDKLVRLAMRLDTGAVLEVKRQAERIYLRS